MKTPLERQDYPDLRDKTHLWQGIPRRIDVGGGPLRPYDVAGWTLPLQMELEAVEIDRPMSTLPLVPTQGLQRVLDMETEVSENWFWYLDPGDSGSWKVVIGLLARGIPVGVEVGGESRFIVEPDHGGALSEEALAVGNPTVI